MIARYLAAACLAIQPVATLPSAAQTVDLAILDGKIVDGTGAPARQGDVLIRGDTIVFVGDADEAQLRAARTIDARGRIVTPGFIDNHAHGNPLLGKPLDNFLLQGTTTVVLGQDGVSPQDDDTYRDRVSLADWQRANAGHDTPSGGPVTLAQWLAAVDRKGTEVNVAALSGEGTSRTLVGGRTEAPLTPEQQRATETILRADLKAGAFGMSTGLEYVPGRYASPDELIALADIVGAVDGIVMSHLRSEDDDKIAAAIDELIAQGRSAHVNVSHLKIVYGQRPEQARAVLKQLSDARARGIRISADVYPYYAGYADLGLVYPDWAKRKDQWDAAVRDRRDELEAALRARVIKRNGPDAILIADGKYAGKTLAQIAAELKMPFEKVLIDVFGFGGPEAAHRVMSPAVQDLFVTDPGIAISSDGGPWIDHPRSWGTAPRMLEEFVVERRALTIEQAIHKMSGLPAETLGLTERGTIAVGKKADINVIDLEHVVSNATWQHPSQPPSGYDAVIVNGSVAVDHGINQPGKFGRALRRPGSSQ